MPISLILTASALGGARQPVSISALTIVASRVIVIMPVPILATNVWKRTTVPCDQVEGAPAIPAQRLFLSSSHDPYHPTHGIASCFRRREGQNQPVVPLRSAPSSGESVNSRGAA